MKTNKDRNIYAARRAGWPGFVAVIVDKPRWKKETARELAAWVREGYTIERVTHAESCAGISEYLAEAKRRRAETPAEPTQEGLFE